MTSHSHTSGMKRRLATIFLPASVILLAGAPARGQSGPSVWVEGRISAERDESFGSPGTGPVFGGALGVDWHRLGLRFDVDVPSMHEGTVIETYSDGPALVRSTSTWRRHSPGWSVAGALTLVRNGRASVSVLAGWANISHREDPASTVVERLRQDGSVLERHEYLSPQRGGWHPGVVLGLDVAVPLGRLVIVPEVRLVSFPLSDVNGDFIARGGVACRWRF